MKEVYRYLYIAAATCIIGIGSGFVTLSPTVLNYEKDANLLKNKVENALKIKITKNTVCEKHKTLIEECNNALYLLNTSESYINLLQTIVKFLFVISAMIFSLGAYLHFLVFLNAKKQKT